MTINDPAPTVLRFLNTASIRPGRFRASTARTNADETAEVRARRCASCWHVQADSLKEDQGQNTCLFSTISVCAAWPIFRSGSSPTRCALYSVSISGYNGQAGRTPSVARVHVANAFTYVAAYLAAAWPSTFAPNLSFFFSTHGP